jgi:hypothetical protein
MPVTADLKPVEFVPAQCPNCSGQLQLPKNRPAVKCMYCGADIAVPSALSNSQSTANLLELARTAQFSGNQEEAYRYFTKVLESDPCHCEAWLGKGIAAGWQSTLANVRLAEMCVAIGKAMELSDEGSRTELATRAADGAGSAAIAIWRLSWEHTNQFAGVEGTWGEHLDRSAQALDVLRLAHEWVPQSESILESIVHICTQDLKGVTYQTWSEGGIPLKGICKPSKEHALKLQCMWETAVSHLKSLRPDYRPPQVAPEIEVGNLILMLISGAVVLWILSNVFYRF